jgi:hypothetical protein
MTRGCLDQHSGLPTSRDRAPLNEQDSFHFYIGIEDSACHVQILHAESNLQSQCVGNSIYECCDIELFQGKTIDIKVRTFPDIRFVDRIMHAISVNGMRCPLCRHRNTTNPNHLTELRSRHVGNPG